MAAPVALMVGLSTAGVLSGGSVAASATSRTPAVLTRGATAVAASANVTAAASTLTLNVVGTVNLGQLGGPPIPSASTPQGPGPGGFGSPGGQSTAASKLGGGGQAYHVAPLRVPKIHSTAPAATKKSPGLSLPTSSLDAISNGVGGSSFDGVDAQMNSSSNSPYLGAGGDVSPPDQALGVGPGPSGPVEVEMVNDTLDVYSATGQALIGALPAFQVFDQAPSSFMSDPRVYWDPASGHWFLTMFADASPGGTVGQYGCSNGGAVENNCMAAQFVAVSASTDPLGTYTVFWFDTTDGTDTSGAGGHIGNDCPCFGDYDQVGSDSAGFYIATNEFCNNTNYACTHSASGGFNGAVIYAMSKRGLISAAEGGPAPTIVRYGVDNATDPFGAYHLSPSTVTQGSSAPDTEYFVESNANLPGDPTLETSGLEVFALLGTGALQHNGTPQFAMTTVGTEDYTAVPPNAVQQSGPMPFGVLAGSGVTPSANTDFNAVQEVTYASGILYAELDTGLGLGMQENSGAAWFALRPTAGASSITVANSGNGYVETSQDILYPDISVNANGLGYMNFAIAGPAMYPSAAYVSFHGAGGPGTTVQIAASGAAPLDDFTCYSPFGPPCRYGDYSMAQEYNGTTYMATEYIPAAQRDVFANWGTRLYSQTDH